MDAAQWSQQVAGFARPMEEITSPPPTNNSNNPNNPLNNNNSRANTTTSPQVVERKVRPQKDQNVNCPRCNSTNTKFCYYNNYSLTQPRFFCKTCRRYWTQGGSLRNVPVGGGSRKNKRSSSSSSSPSILSSSSSTPTNKMIPDLNPPSSLSHLISASHQNPSKFLEGHDLNLAFPIQGIFHHPLDHHHQHHHQLPKVELNNNNNNNNENHEPQINMNGNISTSNTSCTTTTTSCNGNSAPISALELLRTGMASRGSLNPYVPMPMPDSNTLYPSGFPNLQEFKPSMNLFTSPGDDDNDNNMVGSGDHNNNNNNNNSNNNNVGGTSARLLFPFADMNKLASSTTTTNTQQQQHHEIDDQSKGGDDHHHHHHHQHHNHHHHQGPTAGYWSGMLGGGTW